MKKVIITGANGFVGRYLVKEMSDNGITVFAVVRDAQKATDLETMPGVTVVETGMDCIATLPELITDRDIDVCIHLAWAGNSGAARADYSLQLDNVKYSLDLIRVLKEMNVKRFVGAGSLAEMDVLSYHPLDGATPNPVSDYGIAKLTAEYMTKAECAKTGLEHVWCFLANTYGPVNTTMNFVNMASGKMLKGERAAFTSGEQYYDFAYITDTAKGLRMAAENGKSFSSYYLGSGAQRQLKEYIKLIRDAIDPKIPLYLGEIPFNGTSLDFEAFSIEKTSKETGFKPEVSFEDGIKTTIEWLSGIQK